MSLLMEALRKAETIKKQKAELDSEEGGPVMPVRHPSPGVPEKEETEFSAPKLSDNHPLVIDEFEEVPEPGYEETPIMPEAAEILADDSEITAPENLSLIPPQVSRQEMGEDPAALNSSLKSQRAEPDSAIEPSPIPTATTPVVDIGPKNFAEDSRQTAQAVFLAKSRHKSKIFRRKLLGYSILLLLGIGSAVGFLYLSAKNPAMDFKSIPIIDTPPPLPEPTQSQPTEISVAASPSKEKDIITGSQDATTGRSGSSLFMGSELKSPLPDMNGQSRISPDTVIPTAVADTNENLPITDLPVESFIDPKPLHISELEAASPPSILISKRAVIPQSDTLLSSANGFFELGQYQKSRSSYQQILQDDPEHRGALLGLAALARRGQDPALARDLYLRILTRDPSDPLAKAGLLSTMAGGDPVRFESELKLLIEIHPDLAPLFFLLGNLYASGQRWNEAQEAYFNAVQLARKNGAKAPDYSFNLAVSLERLSQPDLAARYYREAVHLSEHRSVGFDREALKRRLIELESGVSQ